MTKMRYYFSTVNSGKTARAIITARNNSKAGKKVLVLQPEVNTRDGAELKSRAVKDGFPATVLKQTNSIKELVSDVEVLIIDEIQFITESQADELIELVCEDKDMLIFTFGLRSDFKGNVFPIVAKLFPYFSKIEEIDTVCERCGKHKATMNLRIDDYDSDSDSVSVGNHYIGVCYNCYMKGVLDNEK